MVENNNQIIVKIHKPSIIEYLFFLLSGILISIPFTIFFEEFANLICITLPLFAAQVCSVAVLTPFIEEFGKAYPLFYRHGETRRSIFTLGLLTGLGFGITEFFLYVFVYNTPFLIRLPGLFFHAANTSIVAYGLGIKKPLIFFLIAVFLHFSYNFFTMLGTSVWYVVDLFILIYTYVLSYLLYKRTSETIINNIK